MTIVILYILALSLRLIYYTVMHVWSNVIWSTKKLKRKELTPAAVAANGAAIDDTSWVSDDFHGHYATE